MKPKIQVRIQQGQLNSEPREVLCDMVQFFEDDIILIDCGREIEQFPLEDVICMTGWME